MYPQETKPAAPCLAASTSNRNLPPASRRELADGLNVDLDAAGEVVGFDIDHASTRVDLTTLETVALPVRTIRAP